MSRDSLLSAKISAASCAFRDKLLEYFDFEDIERLEARVTVSDAEKVHQMLQREESYFVYS